MSSLERRIRSSLLSVVLILTAAAWYLTYFQVRNMGMLMHLGVPLSMSTSRWADWRSFLAFTGMWSIMMVAMMLPSTYPTLLLYRTVLSKRSGSHGSAFLFSIGYFLTWTAAGVVFFAADIVLGAYRDVLSPSSIIRIAGGALAISGLYQISPLKRACLRHCQNPFDFLAHHWRDGRFGAFRMGVEHGMFCFGCCWGLMVILFVVGLMQLGWMAAIGAIILVEKLMPGRRWFPNAIGLLFALLGLLIILVPSVLSKFSGYAS